MFAVYEFEFFTEDGWVVALPFGMDGGTQGTDEADAARMAADWLRGEIEHSLMTDTPMPTPTFGNLPEHGGRIGIVAVDASLASIDSVSAAEAARLLGVTQGRISQMLASGQLEGYHVGRAAFITRASIEARIAESPKAGRPPARKREPVIA